MESNITTAGALQIPLRRRSIRTPKFTIGEKFDTFPQLIAWLRRGKYVYLRGKVKHPAWILNMSINTVQQSMLSICRAELNPDWKTEIQRVIETYEEDIPF